MGKWAQFAVFCSLAVVALIGSWFFWNGSGFSETPPSLPQFVEVYVAGSASAAAVTLAATLTPEFGPRRDCSIETSNCDYADETLTVQVTPKTVPADWILVVDNPPSSSVPASIASQFVKSPVALSAPQGGSRPPSRADHSPTTPTPTVPAVGFSRFVWIHHEVDTNSVRFSLEFDKLPIVSRPTNHLVIALPDLFNEFDPSAACGPQVGYVDHPSGLLPIDLGNAFCPSGTTPIPPPTPDNNLFAYYAPEAATATQVLKVPDQFKNYTLDSSDGATPFSDRSSSSVPDAYDWTGNYQLQPTVYASNIQGAGRVSRAQVALGVALGALFAAIFTSVQIATQKKNATTA